MSTDPAILVRDEDTAERPIRIVTAPKVYLVGVQAVRTPALDEFLNDNGSAEWEMTSTSAGENLAELGGRLCYDSFKSPRPGGNKAYLGRILQESHGSVCEHAVYTLIITGVSRSLTHELIRHRVGLSPSQLSQRYVDESDVAFVLPPALAEAYDPFRSGLPGRPIRASAFGSPLGDAFETWYVAAREASRSYRSMVASLLTVPTIASLEPTARRKAAREAARSVLPNCTETKIQLTGNARAWRHLIEQRGSAGADAEFRRLAFAILAVLVAESPNIFGDYRTDHSGPVTAIATPHRKV